MNILQDNSDLENIAILPEDVPVTMPKLPPTLAITSAQQFKAISDPTRSRILGIIQNQPATAKQIADRLGIAPGTIGYHLQVLETARLARVVARRLVRGIVAKYYTRTARIFTYQMPHEAIGEMSGSLEILTHARDEMADTLATASEDVCRCTSFPHARLSPERIQVYQQRLEVLVDDFLKEETDPNGQIYGLCVSLFMAPAYMQNSDLSISSV